MAKTKAETAVENKAAPRCLPIAREGIQTSFQLAQYLSAIMSDVIEGTISPIVANAGVNAAGKLLKTVEMRQKYGTPQGGGEKRLQLCGPGERPSEESVSRAARIEELERELLALKSN